LWLLEPEWLGVIDCCLASSRSLFFKYVLVEILLAACHALKFALSRDTTINLIHDKDTAYERPEASIGGKRIRENLVVGTGNKRKASPFYGLR
jgi:hypothetical protein